MTKFKHLEGKFLDIETPCLSCLYSYRIFSHEDEILMCSKPFKRTSCLRARKSKICGPNLKSFKDYRILKDD